VVKGRHMKISNYRKVEALNAEQGSDKLRVRWLITKEIGAENFAMRLFEMEPGGFSPLHSHPWEHEIYILEGKGLATNGKDGKEFNVGDFIFVPPNELHQLRNTSQNVVSFLCLIPYKQTKQTSGNSTCTC
jgi:quercetin dioxygenase-like cupin family protein